VTCRALATFHPETPQRIEDRSPLVWKDRFFERSDSQIGLF
jgi:hypothetical protein